MNTESGYTSVPNATPGYAVAEIMDAACERAARGGWEVVGLEVAKMATDYEWYWRVSLIPVSTDVTHQEPDDHSS